MLHIARRTLLGASILPLWPGQRALWSGPAISPVSMPVYHSIPTNHPVAFICIDDGYQTPTDALDYVRLTNLAVNPFLTYYAATNGQYTVTPGSARAAYFIEMAGGDPARIGCHGKEHIDLTTLTLAQQTTYLQQAATWLGQWLGAPSKLTLFAPPYGKYNDDTLQAALSNGFKFVRRWTHGVAPVTQPDGTALSTVDGKWGTPSPRPGDVVLCHFTDTLAQDLAVAVKLITDAGLTPSYILDYV